MSDKKELLRLEEQLRAKITLTVDVLNDLHEQYSKVVEQLYEIAPPHQYRAPPSTQIN